MKKKKISIEELIAEMNQFKEGFLYTKSHKVKKNEAILLVYDNDNYEIPPEKIDEFKYRMGIFQMDEIIKNLKMQISNPNTEKYINAINYYIENDAFIRLN
jgi:hypothetical protein